MDYTHYTDKPVILAVELVNLFDEEVTRADLQAFLDRHFFAVDRVDHHHLVEVEALSSELREIFAAADENEKVDLINTLLTTATVVPRLSTHGDEGPHFHYAPEEVDLLERLRAFTGMGLATVVALQQHDRLGICDATDCNDAYIDTSKNATKRFCSGTCSTRTNVAAFRARRRSAGG